MPAGNSNNVENDGSCEIVGVRTLGEALEALLE